MGKLQDIRRFTGQIRKPSGEIVGTAFAVDFNHALLVTCKHVIEAVSKPCEVGTPLYVYFPLIGGEPEDKTFPAKVERVLADHDDDIVILKLEDDTLPPGVEVAVIGSAEPSTNCHPAHEFRSFGFRSLDEYQGLPAYGTIIDYTLIPDGKTLHIAPLMLESQHIDRGMSGAAVLDMERNLVVGVITETWYSRKSAKDEYTGFAIDSAVVHMLSDDIRIYTEVRLADIPSQPPTEQGRQLATNNPVSFPLAPSYHPEQPPTLDEWVGRDDLLKHLDADYTDDAVHVTSLIGFGGEGKSSVAYKWLSGTLESDPPDASFWWNFYNNPSFEMMIEKLTSYLFGETFLQQVRSATARVDMIGALVTRERRVLLVLDGFEVMQENDGDRYGTINNNDVKRLLDLFAGGEHRSFCLVTSRAPLLDLLNSRAHIQHEVTRLTPDDGVRLLRNVGVDGDESTLTRVVNDWGGHALTVSLIGSYLHEVKDGYVTHYDKSLFPELDDYAENEDRYQGVSRILHRYDQHLDETDRTFLKLFTVFRLPVPANAFERVFRVATSEAAINASLADLNDTDFAILVNRLEIRRLIKRSRLTYTMHPLVHDYYLRLLENENSSTQTTIHQTVAEYYWESAVYQLPSHLERMLGKAVNPTLDNLQPYIEVVHHLCRASAYDKAHQIQHKYILQDTRYVITQTLAAHETYLNLLLDFFPDRDTSKDPSVTKDRDKHFILNSFSLCLMNLGRLVESLPFYERGNKMSIEYGDSINAARGYSNVSEVYVHTGQLAQAAAAAKASLKHVAHIELNDKSYKQTKRTALAWSAWIAHLQGEIDQASEMFAQAEALEKELYSNEGIRLLVSIRGIQHADHLRRVGDAATARYVTEANLKFGVLKYKWISDESRCYRILGDLNVDGSRLELAQKYYKVALRIARYIDRRDVLIEALLAYGRWHGLYEDKMSGCGLLKEALGYCINSDYKLYEAQARVILAEIALNEGNKDTVASEASRALAIGYRTGYHWAKVDAQSVLDRLASNL